jgi:hypothetical protein
MIVFSFLIIPFSAQSYTINDTGTAAYWGGHVVNAGSTAYGDVIGSPYFTVDQMDVTRSGKDWTITLSGLYFQYHQNSSIDGGLPYNYGPGDLYINSKGWNATQDASGHYSTDVFTSSEGWDYVVTQSPTGGWGLYTLDYSKITYTTAPSNYIYRSGQAWQGGVDDYADDYMGAATYSYDTVNNTLTFSFNTGNLNWTGPVGFHWDMKCGNDVVEGRVPAVPEPTTILLLGLGLMGLAGVRRKFIRSKLD